jgi:hypothetical protein
MRWLPLDMMLTWIDEHIHFLSRIGERTICLKPGQIFVVRFLHQNRRLNSRRISGERKLIPECPIVLCGRRVANGLKMARRLGADEKEAACIETTVAHRCRSEDRIVDQRKLDRGDSVAETGDTKTVLIDQPPIGKQAETCIQ